MIAFCGLNCDTCPIYQATIEKDKSIQQTMRESIAEKCNAIYNMNLIPDEVGDCDGCKAITGRIFSACLSCAIRTCAMGKNIENCAYCIDYACENIKMQFLLDPGAQRRLEEIRSSK